MLVHSEAADAARHAKARRMYTSGAPASRGRPSPAARRSTACAIVPLYPNELSPTTATP